MEGDRKVGESGELVEGEGRRAKAFIATGSFFPFHNSWQGDEIVFP